MSDADPASNGDPSRYIEWERLARTETHPLRVAILEVLQLDGGRTLSPRELSWELQAPLGTTSYHVHGLVSGGFLRLVHTRPVRGAKEHFYCPHEHSGKDLFARLHA